MNSRSLRGSAEAMAFSQRFHKVVNRGRNLEKLRNKSYYS